MSECNTCLHRSLYEMITSGQAFGYAGNIPCYTCTRFNYSRDQYAPAQCIVEPETQATNTGMDKIALEKAVHDAVMLGYKREYTAGELTELIMAGIAQLHHA